MNDDDETYWRDKILHILDIYPCISPAMLQVGLGTSIPSRVWRPVLDRLIKAGEVTMHTQTSFTDRGRQYQHKIIQRVQPDPQRDRDPGSAIEAQQ
jgi:hypothetical protein